MSKGLKARQKVRRYGLGCRVKALGLSFGNGWRVGRGMSKDKASRLDP